MTEQELEECIAEVKHSDIPESSKKKIMNVLYEQLHKEGWIPCSERLPDIEADVMLSLRSLDIYTGYRANTEGMFYVAGEGYVEYENVLAWQPLPEPYKGR